MAKGKTHILKVVVGAVCFYSSFLAAGRAESCQAVSEFAEPKILAKFRVTKGGGPIFLPVRFQGKELLFLLDTGATCSVFDTSLKGQLGPVIATKKMFTYGNTMVTEFFDAPEAFLGPLNMKACGQVTCLDLGMLSFIVGKQVGGLIGMDLLRQYVIQIDFDRGRLCVLEPRETGHPNWGKELPITYNTLGIPQITVSFLNDIKVNLMIDTGGNTSGNLQSNIFEEVVSRTKAKTSVALLETPSGTVRRREARTANFCLGGHVYKELIFDEGRPSCLGLSFLSRHLVTLDFPNSKIYLKKGEDFEKVDETDMSGLHLLRISNEIVVYSVDEGSPAEKAGIQAKDVIVKIGDKDANRYDMFQLRRLLMSGDERRIIMKIQRGHNVKQVSFLLERKL